MGAWLKQWVTKRTEPSPSLCSGKFPYQGVLGLMNSGEEGSVGVYFFEQVLRLRAQLAEGPMVGSHLCRLHPGPRLRVTCLPQPSLHSTPIHADLKASFKCQGNSRVEDSKSWGHCFITESIFFFPG